MQASTELRTIINSWFDAMATGDVSWVERHTSHRAGVRLVGTVAQEWLEGPQMAEFLRAEVQALGGVIRVARGEVEAYHEGSVGWGLASPIMILPNGCQITPRWSAVFHKEDGEWKLVQLHTSVGVANDALRS